MAHYLHCGCSVQDEERLQRDYGYDGDAPTDLDLDVLFRYQVVAKNLREYFSLVATTGDALLCRHRAVAEPNCDDVADAIALLLRADGVKRLDAPHDVVRHAPVLPSARHPRVAPRRRRFEDVRASLEKFVNARMKLDDLPYLNYGSCDPETLTLRVKSTIGHKIDKGPDRDEKAKRLAKEAVVAWNEQEEDLKLRHVFCGETEWKRLTVDD